MVCSRRRALRLSYSNAHCFAEGKELISCKGQYVVEGSKLHTLLEMQPDEPLEIYNLDDCSASILGYITSRLWVEDERPPPVLVFPGHSRYKVPPRKLDWASSIGVSAHGVCPWKGPFRLLDQPWDIRRLVLERLITSSTQGVFLAGNPWHAPVGVRVPKIALVNKQLFSEALLVYLNKTTFEIHNGSANTRFQVWLQKLDFSRLAGEVNAEFVRNGMDGIRQLSFPYFSRFPHDSQDAKENNDVTLMQKCRNLKEVTLHWAQVECLDLGNFDWNSMKMLEKSASQICREYQLEGLLGLKNLEVLCFTGWPGQDRGRGVRALAKWLESHYQDQHAKGQRKRAVRVMHGGV